MEGSKLTHFKQASVGLRYEEILDILERRMSSHTEGQNAEQDIRFSGPPKKNLIDALFCVCVLRS